jgi:hypothetical protein
MIDAMAMATTVVLGSATSNVVDSDEVIRSESTSPVNDADMQEVPLEDFEDDQSMSLIDRLLSVLIDYSLILL